MRCHIAATISANRNHRHALFIGRVMQGIDEADGKIMDQSDDLIHQEAVGKHRFLAGIAGFETGANDSATVFHDRFQLVQDSGALFETFQLRVLCDGFKLGKDFFPVNDFALLLDLVGHVGRFPWRWSAV